MLIGPVACVISTASNCMRSRYKRHCIPFSISLSFSRVFFPSFSVCVIHYSSVFCFHFSIDLSDNDANVTTLLSTAITTIALTDTYETDYRTQKNTHTHTHKSQMNECKLFKYFVSTFEARAINVLYIRNFIVLVCLRVHVNQMNN